jgi:hypothetical protein
MKRAHRIAGQNATNEFLGVPIKQSAMNNGMRPDFLLYNKRLKLWVVVEAKDKVSLRFSDIEQIRGYRRSKRTKLAALYISYETFVSSKVEELAQFYRIQIERIARRGLEDRSTLSPNPESQVMNDGMSCNISIHFTDGSLGKASEGIFGVVSIVTCQLGYRDTGVITARHILQSCKHISTLLNRLLD